MKDRRPTRREVLRWMAAGSFSLGLPRMRIADDAELQEKLNVLFLVIDDLRPQLNCYGHRQMISPNIDRLAAEGVQFNRAYCQSPVCGPSRASLMSGMRPLRTRFTRYDARLDEVLPKRASLPEQFRKYGYHTASIGKVFHYLQDTAYAWSDDPWRPNIPAGEDWENYLLNEDGELGPRRSRAYKPPFEAAPVDDWAYLDGEITLKTITDLQRLKEAGKPFFLAVGLNKPHLPFNAPRRYWEMYDRDRLDLSNHPLQTVGAPADAFNNWGELRLYTGIPSDGPVSENMARSLVHGYYACTTYMDALVGRILNELDRLELQDNTIVVFWGDHGWNLGDHGLWCKHSTFETNLLSPLILRIPGVRGGIQCNALVEFVDVYPTLCHLCRVPMPADLEGTTFAPLLKEPELPWKPAVFSRWNNADTIRTERFRYTEWMNDEGFLYARMLIDHRLDPGETVNIAQAPENQEIVQQLSDQLRRGWKYAVPDYDFDDLPKETSVCYDELL